MDVQALKFNELNLDQLYDLLRLRTDIFVVEQQCAYSELDDFDKVATHILGYKKGKLIAYARVLPKATVYEMPSIGRVAVASGFRQKGYGQTIFKHALGRCRKLYHNTTIKIQAQTYLEDFYQSFGFKTVSEPYPDVGVWHVDMVLNDNSTISG